ncbi:ABC transporter ATP-binding protein [Streptomyces sp. NBC_01429]|uniref:ABC transporter ATP-binding protein n=1 Tax=Streptomyces sp. NBC_01429 TaxID=2903862 RepID=UPI002E2E6B5B|nr:ABC transporter ATP-binding protein [Streptomyces sp. NBC_01429]
MALLTLSDVTVRFGARADARTALDAVDLRIAEHEIVCVLGPSGSGKSTLLRVVAGLQHPDGGRVLLDGADQSGVPAHRRGVGLMFQDHQLFPQRDVAGNVAFGLRMRGTAREERAARVTELLDLVGLPGAGPRAVAALSGGEQQRVALARALAPSPRLLMLDEPLGQLDRGLRERLVVELRGLFGRLGTTVLAVTHDQGEAFALADRVVVMRDGRVAQTGTPLEVWQRPASAFVARFLGFDNVVPATVSGGAADTVWGPVPVPDGSPQGERTLLVRPAGVRLGDPAEGLRCTVGARTFRSGRVAVLLRPAGPGEAPLLEAECGLRDAPAEGQAVGVTFTAAEVVVLPAQEGQDTVRGAPAVAKELS